MCVAILAGQCWRSGVCVGVTIHKHSPLQGQLPTGAAPCANAPRKKQPTHASPHSPSNAVWPAGKNKARAPGASKVDKAMKDVLITVYDDFKERWGDTGRLQIDKVGTVRQPKV